MKQLRQWLTAHMPRLRARTVLTAVALLFALCIPTFLALASVFLEPAPPELVNFSVSIYDEEHAPLGSERVSENPEEGATVADILYRILMTAEEAAPRRVGL